MRQYSRMLSAVLNLVLVVVLLFCLSFYSLYQCGNLVLFLMGVGGGGLVSRSIPGSSNILVYNSIFRAHLHNGPGF